jgi:hypothetical protein
MSPSAIERHLPMFVSCYRRLLVFINVIWRVGIRHFPRVAMVIVLMMTCDLAWIVVRSEHSGRVLVPATITQQTQVGFFHRGPAPWPRGNCFTMAPKVRWGWQLRGTRSPDWRVCNVHAENFSEIVKRLGLQTVEVLPFKESYYLITDQRIPREWLLERPCPQCVSEPVGEELLTRYPGRFRDPSKP